MLRGLEGSTNGTGATTDSNAAFPKESARRLGVSAGARVASDGSISPGGDLGGERARARRHASKNQAHLRQRRRIQAGVCSSTVLMRVVSGARSPG